MTLDIHVVKNGNTAEVQLDGYINAQNAQDVDDILMEVVGKFDSIVLDLEKLKYVSSGGLRAFKHAYLELRKKGSKLMAKNVNKMVMEVFEVTGFTRLIELI